METINNKNYYIIFPLNILSLQFSFKFLLNCIYDYHIIQSYLSEDTLNIYETDDSYKNILKYRKSILKNKNISKLRKINNIHLIYLHYKIIKNQNNRYEILYGKDVRVQIHIELIEDILINNVLTEKQFRILCAINSKIGVSKYQIIYNDEIRLRAMGFKSKKVFENQVEKIKYSFYSNKVLKEEVTKLKFGNFGRNFFDRVYDGRKYYYSKIYKGNDLENIVIMKLSKNKFRFEEERNRNRNRKVRDRLKKLYNSKLNNNEIVNFKKQNNQKKNTKYITLKEKIFLHERAKQFLVKLKNLKVNTDKGF
jgi:hypothetical protein